MLRRRWLSLPAILWMAWGAVPGALTAQVKVVGGLKAPESVGIGPDGRVYVSETGVYEKFGDGMIMVIDGDRAKPFATGLNDPHGIKWWRDHLFVADNGGQVWRIDRKGNVERLVDATDFPRKVTNFNDIELDDQGNIYISDSGDWEGRGGVIFKITQQGKVTTVLSDDEEWKLVSPNGLLMEGQDKILEVDYTTGNLFRLDLKSKDYEKINGGFGAADGLTRDARGRLYVSDYSGHKVFILDSPDAKNRQEVEVSGAKSAADIGISPDGRFIIVPDMDGGQVLFVLVPK
jgi:sugar lactone lactonase YvrE